MSDLYCCRWEECAFEGKRGDAIRHVLLNHAPLEQVPFYCSLCKFRATSIKAFRRHFKTFKQHRECLAGEEDREDEYKCCAEMVYNVTWGSFKSDLVEKGTEIVEEIEYMNVAEDMNIFNTVNTLTLGTQTEGAPFKSNQELKEEIFVLKGAHQNELNKMADYISRMEKRLQEKDKELKTKLDQKDWEIEELKVQIRRREPFVRGFEEMWEEMKSPSPKKRRSVISKRLF